MIEYDWDDLLKIFFDIDIKSATAPDVAALKRQMVEERLQPFFRFVYAKRGVRVDMGNVACSDDTRKTDEGYKFSMHIFINNVVCSAQSLKYLHSSQVHASLPAIFTRQCRRSSLCIFKLLPKLLILV